MTVLSIDWRGRQLKDSSKITALLRKTAQTFNSDGVYAWCLALTLLAGLFMAGCASAPTPGRVLVIPVENQLLEPVSIYLNGFRVRQLEALESRTILLPESVLVEGRCLYATASLRMSDVALSSDRVCIPQGGRFTLKVGLGNHLWLSGWR